MRAKVILIAMGGAAAILLPALYFHFKPDAPAAPDQPQTAAVDNTAPSTETMPPILKRAAQSQAQDTPTVEAPSNFQFSSDPDECKSQLIDLSASDNPANLKLILTQLENQNPDIRQAALNATIQFNSKDAIPTLQNEMNWATDPEEKVSIKKAIDFLSLPSFGSTGDNTDVSQADTAPASN